VASWLCHLRHSRNGDLKVFVESIKADGFVTKALARNGHADATVAPPG